MAALVIKYVNSTNTAISIIFNGLLDLQKQTISLERLVKYLKLKKEGNNNNNNKLLTIPKEWPEKGEIIIKELYVMYKNDYFEAEQELK